MAGIIDFIAGMAQGGANPQTGQPNTIGERLLNGVKALDEGYSNYAQDATKAKALRQVVAAYAQDEPDPDKQKNIIDFSHTAGLGDLEGFVQGHATLAGLQKQRADIAELQGRGQYYKDFGAYREQQAGDDATSGGFLRNYLTAPKTTDEDGNETDMAPEDRLAWAAKKTPNMSGRILPQIMQSLAGWDKTQAAVNPTTDPTTQFDEDPVTHQRFARLGKEILSSGINQGAAGNQPIYSPDGKMFWNGKGWSEFREQGFPAGTTVKTVNGVNVLQDGSGRILKTLGPSTASQALSHALGADNDAAATPQFKSADDVKAAYRAGKLPRATAIDILSKQFGYK